jgi:hypothetical protein
MALQRLKLSGQRTGGNGMGSTHSGAGTEDDRDIYRVRPLVHLPTTLDTSVWYNLEIKLFGKMFESAQNIFYLLKF